MCWPHRTAQSCLVPVAYPILTAQSCLVKVTYPNRAAQDRTELPSAGDIP